jgi:hypothetical protein
MQNEKTEGADQEPENLALLPVKVLGVSTGLAGGHTSAIRSGSPPEDEYGDLGW